MNNQPLAPFDLRWKVLRHGGRRNNVERVLYEGDNEARARDIFDYWAENIRQGSVRLTDATCADPTVQICQAPRLRTRW